MTGYDRNSWDQPGSVPHDAGEGMPWSRVLGIPLLLFAIVGVLLWLQLRDRGGQKLEETGPPAGEVFTGPAIKEDSPEYREIHQTLTRLGRAFHQGATEEAVSLFDTQRMLEQIEASGLNRRFNLLQRFAATRELAEGLRIAFQMTSKDMAFVRFEIKQLKFSPDRSEVLAYIRQWDDEGTSMRYRWWLRKSQGAWRIYDYEELETGTRTSVNMAMVMNSSPGPADGVSAVHPQMMLLLEARQAASMDDIEGLRARVLQIQTSELFPAAQALVHMLRAIVHLHDEDYQQVLAECDLAETFQSDYPVLAYLRAPALLHLERYEEALDVSRRFIEHLGDEGKIYHYLGHALEGLGRSEEALAAYRRGLDDEPNSHDLLWAFGLALPDDEMEELRERFLALRRPWEHFESLCEEFMEYGASDAVETLANAHLEQRPDDRRARYYLAWAKWMRDANDEAAELVLPLWKEAEDDEQRQRFRELYLDAMLDAGKPVAAYQALDYDRDVFLYLGHVLSAGQQGDDLEALLAEHRRHAPEDSALRYLTGLLHYARGEYAEAADLLSDWSEMDDPERRDFVEERYLRTMYLLGRTVEVYDRSDDPNRCFALLADWLGEDARTEELRRLVEHHQLTAPDDSLLIHYQGRIAELEEDWETAASMYRRELEAADVAAEGNARFHLVHALYKAGRIEEALESVPPLEETANQLANYLEADEDLARLKELLQKGGELLSETARTYFEAWLLYSEKQYAASAEQLRAMVTTRSPEEPYVGRMQHLYLDNCVKLGTGLEAYRDLPDPEVAFVLLASRYVEERQADELRQLIEVHQQGHPSGRNLDFFQGEAAVVEEQWETAIAAFRRALEKSSDEDGSWRERRRLVELLDERGRWREAYETIEPASTVFSQLAWRMFHGERADDLASLLEMRSQREQTEDDSHASPFWLAQLDYLRGDYESAARRYEEHRAEIARSGEIHAAHEWWVATLVRLGRLDEALQQALIHEAESYLASLSLATVHAARHEIPQTLQALAKCLRQGYSVEEFYADKLLGSLLKSEALAEVRERYPPPEE